VHVFYRQEQVPHRRCATVRNDIVVCSESDLHFGWSLQILISFLSGLQQRRAPCAGGEQGSEEDDGVDAGSSLGRPVDVLKVEPESEFVEGEGGSDSVEDRHNAAEENRRIVAAGSDFGEPGITDEKKNDDAEDEVVDVASTMHDEMKGRNVVEDGIDDGAHSGEGKEEADRSAEQTFARTVRNPFVNELAERRALQQQQQEGCAGE
jgi:hypothetical protein